MELVGNYSAKRFCGNLKWKGSREKKHQVNLMRSLTVYRLVFGQNRQEDMVQFLLRNADAALIGKIAKECNIDLSPPVTVSSTHQA
jgi:hypothetical protein